MGERQRHRNELRKPLKMAKHDYFQGGMRLEKPENRVFNRGAFFDSYQKTGTNLT